MEKRILIRRWLGSETQFIPIYDEASVSSARQRVRDAGQPLNLSRELIESVALIASELTHNHLRYAKQGYFGVRPIEHGGQKGLEVIAADLGPGIERPAAAIRGQMPKETGSLGAGIAAVCRLADEVAWDNRISEGACIIVRKFEAAASSLCEAAIMSKPYPGEPISGDDAIIIHSEAGFLAAVSDGLGHGPEAREASSRAIEVVSKSTKDDLDQIAIRINQELAGTRGCAISLMRFIRNEGALEYVSAGDVYAHLYHLRDAHFFTPTPMVLGTGQLRAQKLRIERTEVKPNSVLVMFTDGLKSRTNLKGELDVLRQPAIVIAQHLLDTQSRPDDDALVCVVRFTVPQT
jgi:anti-sigma regulatory factor (Ser/Thr protein kinase)